MGDAKFGPACVMAACGVTPQAQNTGNLVRHHLNRIAIVWLADVA